MFSKITILFGLLFLCCFSLCYYFQIRERDSDKSDYTTFIARSKDLSKKKTLKIEPAKQLRKGVQKDIWTIKDNERTHFKLKSENSDLIIKQLNNKLDVTEYLHNLECISQEGIDRVQNKQEIRGLSSAEGIYYFPSHRFTANMVNLFFFYLPGIELPMDLPSTNPYLRGKAYDVTFTAENKTLQFTAHHLKAFLDSDQVVIP